MFVVFVLVVVGVVYILDFFKIFLLNFILFLFWFLNMIILFLKYGWICVVEYIRWIDYIKKFLGLKGWVVLRVFF